MFFGFLAMNLLEYICRLCATSEPDLLVFSNNLNATESKYFIHLPLAGLSVKRDSYSLPYVDKKQKGDLLLTLLFDTIRNGLAHMYQPTVVTLKDGKQLYFVLKGASGKIIRMKNSNHLCYNFDGSGNICVLVYPEYLLRDFQQAAEASGLFDKQLQVEPFLKDGEAGIQRLEKALKSGGATRCYVGRVRITHP